jgi:hypothetical protein
LRLFVNKQFLHKPITTEPYRADEQAIAAQFVAASQEWNRDFYPQYLLIG